jgi:RNA polymerase sigma factor (sigma-70 family)
MAERPLQAALHHIRKLAGVRATETLPDSGLLDRFVRRQDEAAFAALVERHGPMVLAVCRRALRHAHDAEDACQAAFLVLARKAASVRKRGALPSWLHGVAYHVAANLRRDLARRAGREVPLRDAARDDPAEATWRDVRAALDEELARLPDRYRAPLVLCYLEGKTRDEAAQALGWSLGALRGRLERGRDLLRARLLRRGLGLSSALLAGSLGPQAGAAVPSTLAVSTVRAARLYVAGRAAASGMIPPRVAAQSEGVLRAMSLTKLKIASTALAVSCLVLAGGILSAGQAGVKPEAGREQAAQRDPQPARGRPPVGVKPEARGRQAAVERFRQAGEAVDLAFSPDGTVLAAYAHGSPDSSLKLSSAITGERLGEVAVGGQGVNSRPFAFSPDGQVVAVVDLQFRPTPGILCCDPASGKAVRTLSLPEPGPVGPVLLRFSADGKLLAVAVTCNRVLVLDSATGKQVQEVGDTPNTIFSLAFSPDNKSLALGVSAPALQIWDVTTGKRLPHIRQRPEDSTAASLAYSSDGALLAAGRGNHITLYDVATGRERRRLEAPMRLVNGLAFLPGGDWLVSASHDGKVRVWDLRTGGVQWALDGAAEGRSLAVSPDGRAVALGTVNHAIVWDLPFARDDTPADGTDLAAADWERLWSGLARDAPEAHQALRTLRAAPGAAVSFLRRHLRPAAVPDADTGKRVRALLGQLDSGSFSKREAATRALEKLGPGPEPLLREALAAGPSLEVRRRLERLLKGLEQQSLRDWRAVKLLEHLGTPRARELLDRLARGADAWLTREARAAVGRLAKRLPATR